MGTARALEPGRWAWAGLTRGSHGVPSSGSPVGCCTRSTCPRRPAHLQARGSQCRRVGPEAPTGSPAPRARLTWPPQVLAPLGQCGAGARVAVAARAGGAVLLEGVLWARRPLAVAVLLQVTGVLRRAAGRAGWRHLAGRTSAQWEPRPRAPGLLLCHGAPGPAPLLTSGPPGVPRSPCTRGSRRRGRTRPPRPAGTRWRCSRHPGSPGGGGAAGVSEGRALGRLGVGRPTGRPRAPPRPPISMAPCRPQGTGAVWWWARPCRAPRPAGGRPRVEGGGRWWAPRTWGWPQSHCSPRSTKPFPHTGPPTRRSGSGALARQPVREFSTNLSRSTWLHWLNLLGNGELRGRACHQGAGGGGRDTAPPTPGSGPRPGWTSLTQCGPP